MENLERYFMDLLDRSLSEEELNRKIDHTHCVKSLILLLNIKKRRILNGESKKIVYPLHKIYEQETEDNSILCEVLNLALLVSESLDEGIIQIITYLNSQIDKIHNFFNSATKVAWLINEIILICKNQKRERLFQENISLSNLERFLFQVTIQKRNSLGVYILSTVFPNYISVLNESHKMLLWCNIFLQCKTVQNLDMLCVIISCVDENILLTNSRSVLTLKDFWQYLENCILYDNSGQRKQALFLLKRWVHSNATLKCKIPYLQTTDIYEKVWQHFFILLDASKEKQLHLVQPSLNLLNSLNHINIMWQVCVYKSFLVHTQNVVVYFVASHILQQKIFLLTLNKFLVSAINKNEYTDYSTETFKKLPIYCNSLDEKNFILFLEDMLDVIWAPTAAWCLFSNVFSEKLTKIVPFSFIESIYMMLKRLPHVYIRNGCISIVLNYFIRNFNWKNNFEETLMLLFILKDYDIGLFLKTISKYIDIECLEIILAEREKKVLDEKTFEILVQIFRILKCKHKLPLLEKDVNEKSLLVLYANFFEEYSISDIEEFVLKHLTNLDENYTELFFRIAKKLLKSHIFSEKFFEKVFLIIDKPTNYSKTTVFVSLYIVLNLCEKSSLKKYLTTNLKEFLNGGKTDDGLYTLFLNLYFLTEEKPEVSFLESVLHHQSDIIIFEMFKCLSTIDFQKTPIEVVYFLKDSINVLQSLVKSRHFKKIVANYIDCIFSISFLETLHNSKLFDVMTFVTDSLSSLSETFPIIDYYLSIKIKETIACPRFPNIFSRLLIPVIQDLLLRGAVIKKDDRVEYYVCQEVCENVEIQEDNPNMVKIATRMFALETVLKFSELDPKYADDFTDCLLKKYRMYFGKRYFPDSQIHIQKLRIFQALLTVHPFINSQRQQLIDLIIESFCTEIHQPCVKQLMQWLLLSLLKDQNDCFDLIKSKINTASKTQPSSIVAFIVVLLHLTISRDESYWGSVVESLIPWSMGAHFKLRVYSQAAIKKLLDEAKRKHFQNFLNTYGYLEKSIVSVIEASGHAFHDALKSDELIFRTFIPERDYSLESIYIDIPKLNGVIKTEWENIKQFQFATYKSIETVNKDRTFSNSVNLSIKNNKDIINEETFESVYNIQRKITPWTEQGVDQQSSKRTSNFILIASLVAKSTNLGGLSRTCEVFGVKRLVLNDTKILKDKEFKSLSMSSEEWIDAVEVKITELKNYIYRIRAEGYSVIGAEQTSDSLPLHKYTFNKKTALVLGNEKEGIPPDIIPILDVCIEIPQFGMVRSLNVHVAGAAFIWEYAKQHLVQ